MSALELFRICPPFLSANCQRAVVSTSHLANQAPHKPEALRKKATQGPAKPAKKSVSPLDALLKPRDAQKNVSLKVASDTLAKSKSLRVAVSFENSDGVVQQREQTIELGDASDAQSLSVNLKITS